MAKGFRGARKSQIRLATEATNRAMAFMYRGRKERKRDLRTLWIIRISAAAKLNGYSYNKLVNGLKKANVALNRKMLAELAVKDQGVFSRIVALAQNAK